MKNNRTLLIIVGVILVCCCIGGIAVVVTQGPAIGNYLNSLQSGIQPNPASTTSPATSSPATSSPATSAPGGASTSAPASGPAAGGLGDDTLKTDVWNSIVTYEGTQSCNAVTSSAIDVNSGPDSKGGWIENWTVRACGQTVVFKVKFTVSSKGGTDYTISH